VLRKVKGVTDVTHRRQQDRDVYVVQAQRGLDLRDEVSQAIFSNGWRLRSMQLVGMSLEEIFLRLTTEEEL
jgi:ABC-2 type transport system ATP-binding protein